jgi:hypothetical protein
VTDTRVYVPHHLWEAVEKLDRSLFRKSRDDIGEFTEDLRNLLNHHSRERGSNTPDFILAEFLEKCLEAFDRRLEVEGLDEGAP